MEINEQVPGGESRMCDAGGCGYFGASRDHGTRIHKGLDILADPAMYVISPADGVVRISGTDVKGEKPFKLIEIYNSETNTKSRPLYVVPNSGIQTKIVVNQGDIIGVVDNLNKPKGYPSNVPNHTHFEVIKNGTKVNPKPYLFP